MMSDGQLYKSQHKGEAQPPPDIELAPPPPSEHRPIRRLNLNIHHDDLLIIGLIIILLSDKCEPDIPLILALAYILISK